MQLVAGLLLPRIQTRFSFLLCFVKEVTDELRTCTLLHDLIVLQADLQVSDMHHCLRSSLKLLLAH